MNRWRTVSGARNGNRCGGYRKMSVKRTLNRGSNALIADAVSSLSVTSISDAHKRPERGAGRSKMPRGYRRWAARHQPPEGAFSGSPDSENNARARGRTPGTLQSWLRRITAVTQPQNPTLPDAPITPKCPSQTPVVASFLRNRVSNAPCRNRRQRGCKPKHSKGLFNANL